MPIMPGKYPPPKRLQEPEVIFEHDSVETQSQEDLVVLQPTSIQERHDEPSAENPPLDPYNIEHYLLTSSETFSPFEQNLGEAPFQDLQGDDVWAALAYIEDGGVHPAKAVPHLASPIRVPLGGIEYHLPPHSQYSILLPNPKFMEYVPLDDDNKVPQDRTPVPAGCERDGLQKLYFATASVPKTFLDRWVGGRGDEGMIVVPGKWGEHLGGVMVAYDECQTLVKKGGKVLCWKKH